MDLKKSAKHKSPAAVRITVVILMIVWQIELPKPFHFEDWNGKPFAGKGLTEQNLNSATPNRCKMQRLGVAFCYALPDFVFFQFAVEGGCGNIEQPCSFGFVAVGVV